MTRNYERITERACSQRVLGETTLKVMSHRSNGTVAVTKRIRSRRHDIAVK
jgi:hypothetical protein